jgi:malic enzyme
MLDRLGVIHTGRTDLNKYKLQFAVQTEKRTLADAVAGADVFIGVAGEGLFTEEMLRTMAPKPIIFALSNPNPEIQPELAHRTRSDLIMATGRSDYPNQINNALCFPYIFRGALDSRAYCINQAMQIAAVHAIKNLAKEETPPQVIAAYPDINNLVFGPDYIIPKLMDPRLLEHVAPAVANAAKATGVARNKPL